MPGRAESCVWASLGEPGGAGVTGVGGVGGQETREDPEF